jgi:hypothetical protein
MIDFRNKTMGKSTEDILKSMRMLGGNCILCDKHTKEVGIFIADKGSSFDSDNKHKTRVYYYYLCYECHMKDLDRNKVMFKLAIKIS